MGSVHFISIIESLPWFTAKNGRWGSTNNPARVTLNPNNFSNASLAMDSNWIP